MYKSKIQELCQKKAWSLPKYDTVTEGPPHNRRFVSTVTVNGRQFQSSEPTRSSKEAQNNAARLAFDHFTHPLDPTPNSPISLPHLSSLPGCSFPQPSLSLSAASSSSSSFVSVGHNNGGVLQPRSNEGFETPGISSPVAVTTTTAIDQRISHGGVDNSVLQPGFNEEFGTSQISSPVNATTMAALDPKNMQHLFKNQLQNYAHKRNLSLPVYSSELEGPPHNSRFKCKVTIDGKTFESPKLFTTLKDAEHAAAEVALMSLLPGGVQEDQTGLYKNLLQELVQKEGLRLPSYNTNKYGEAHMPIFVSQVEIEGEKFNGHEAKSKKQAEMSAAKVAYLTMKERKGPSSLFPLSAHQGQAPEISSDQVNVSTGPQLHANLKSPVSSGLLTQNPPDKKEELVIVTEKKESFSSGNRNGCLENSSLSTVKSAPSLSDSTNVVSSDAGNNMPSTEVSTLSRKTKFIVYSRKTNVEIEDGGTLMPISDDKWVVYKYSA
ncbi:hypothetical protein RIF29_21590 [Crotalaria pallida]|uniref:DRBM domain-containing protein n=1 Tax=Crotalaria pallida TaxID=3830 RepID=A0AAN9F4U5_CROPI